MTIIYGDGKSFHIIPVEEQEANARLISASPDLLEVAKRVLDDNTAWAITVEKARAAIAKATKP